MAKSMEIPQDIINNIIAEVGDDTDLLKQCTLVSSSFSDPSRKQLFSTITLGNDQTCQGIHQLLVQNPVILSFVRTIILTEDDSSDVGNIEYMNGKSLLAILRLPFGSLEGFSINFRVDFPWTWKSFSSDVKDALSNIVHSSNLKTLSLTGITDLPSTFFLHIVQLTTLELFSISPKFFGIENSSSLTSATSKEVDPTASHVAIERCVWRLREDWDRRYRFIRGPTDSTFLPFISHLRSLEIHINLSSGSSDEFEMLFFLMSSLRVSLTSPATLEHLEVNIWFRGSSNEFEFFEDEYNFYVALRDADGWRQLDSIATHPSGSRLQRVDINIKYSFDDGGEESDKNKVSKAVLDGLPLLRTKGILFVKAVLC